MLGRDLQTANLGLTAFVSDSGACQDYCFEDALCDYFVFDTADSQCFKKTVFSAGTSGNGNLPGLRNSMSHCYQKDKNVVGNDISSLVWG